MSSARSRHSAGYTLTEVIIATAIALLAAGVILQVLILTVRTTHQTSAQADVQAQARAALMDWEQLLRDGYAIVTTYTPHEGPKASQEYTTRVLDDEQTLIAAVPSIDANGAPCTWRGRNVVFDCIIWQALKEGSGEAARWTLSRLIYLDAFRMPDSYFSLHEEHLSPDLFFSLAWGAANYDCALCGRKSKSHPFDDCPGGPHPTWPPPDSSSSSSSSSSGGDDGSSSSSSSGGEGGSSSTSSGGVPYTVPDPLGRDAELSPVVLFSGAKSLAIRFFNAQGQEIFSNGTAGLPEKTTTSDLPLDVQSKARIKPADVAFVQVEIQYAQDADAMQAGRDEVTQSDTQSVTIRLRNRPSW